LLGGIAAVAIARIGPGTAPQEQLDHTGVRQGELFGLQWGLASIFEA
jgi:hypothetical protein